MVAAQKQSIRSPFSQQVESTLRDKSPSTKLVVYTLKKNHKLTISEINERTLLPPRTVRYALRNLKEVNLVNVETDLSDARKQHYQWLGKTIDGGASEPITVDFVLNVLASYPCSAPAG